MAGAAFIAVFIPVTGPPLIAAPDPRTLVVVEQFPGLTFDTPVDIANAGDARLFVVEQAGRIQVVHGRGDNATAGLFLDISERVQFQGEMGLLGLAFHPQYHANGYFYVHYSLWNPPQLSSRVSRFRVTADPDVADRDSELVILELPQPYGNHKGGDLAFAPDGTFYIALGDGGSRDDPENRAQNGQELLGKILRIDVNGSGPGRNYGIPEDNPFIGELPRDEIWALGTRNPWRFSFDRQTGDLWIGDVGQDQWEEINFQASAIPGGENYGWRLKEGAHCYLPQTDCDPAGLLTDPIYEYSNSAGCAVTGGFVYRGQETPQLTGVYLYADYCNGTIYGLERGPVAGEWLSTPLARPGGGIATFGEDWRGEVFFAGRNNGRIYRLLVRPERRFLPLIG
jgi:glucose/arabinose dehydrogenase